MYLLLPMLLIGPVFSQFDEEELFISERSDERNSSNPDKPCPSGSVCTLLRSCPKWSKKYDDFHKDCVRTKSSSCSNLLNELKTAVCNSVDEAFCCHGCKSNEDCVPTTECPDYTRTLAEIGTKRRGSPDWQQLLTSLQGRICDTKRKHVCCQKKVKLAEVRTITTDIKSPSYLPMGENCGVNPEQSPSKIFGGTRTNAGDFPFAALVGISGKRRSSYFRGGTYGPDVLYTKWICGGTVINLWYVITAGHCQGKETRNKISGVRLGEFVVGGSSSISSSEGLPPHQNFDVTPADVIIHEQYRRTSTSLENDIALIRLPRAAKLNAGVQMACLPLDESETALALRLSDLDRGLEGRNTTVIGWGYTCYKKDSNNQNTLEFCRDSPVIPSRFQQYIEIPVEKREKCSFTVNSRIQFCAGMKDKDTCKGDSGGGVFARDNQGRAGLFKPWYLMGIVSFGSKLCGSGQPAVYTRVSAYSEWILNNLRD